jgi:hypothetical protein
MTEFLEPDPQPADFCYAANLSNQALHLRSVSRQEFRLLLTLDALFFDRIMLGATELLANDMLFDLAKSDPSGARTFYGAVLAPVSDGKSYGRIADLMIERRTKHHLANESELRKHAALMDESKPRFLYADEADRRTNFHGLLTDLTSEPRPVLDQLTPSDLKNVAGWLRKQDPAFTYFTELFRWADRNIAKPAARKQLKIVADVAQQIAKCDSQFGVFASPDGDWVDAVRALHERAHPETWTHRRLQPMVAEEEPSLRLDVELVSRLPLEHIAQLRDQQPFRDLRWDLAQHRAGRKRVDPKVLQLRLDEAGDMIADFAARNKLGREAKTQEYTKNAKFRFWSDVGATAVPEAIAVAFGGTWGLVFYIVTAFAFNRFAPRSPAIRTSNTCVSGPRFAPRTGTLLRG